MAKPHGVGRFKLRYIIERGVNVFDRPGNSADLTPIEEVWNIMKKKSVKLPNNKKKKFGLTFVTYGMVFIEKLLRNCMMKCLQGWKLCVRRKVGLQCTVF